MNRWLLGLACLLGAAVTCVNGDYIIIVANVGVTRPKELSANLTAPGGRGGPGLGGPGMGARGGPGMGARGGPGLGGGLGGGSGGQYGGGYGGAYGGGGGGPPGLGGGGGGPPNLGGGGGGQYGSGYGGAYGGGGGGPPGLGGGMAGGGKMGGGGGGFVSNENPDLLEDIEPTPQRIVAIIEVGTGDVAFRQRLASWDQVENLIRSPLPVQVKHHWGLTQLFPSVKDDTMRIVYGASQPWSSVAHSFTLKREKAQKAGPDKQKRLMELADWTLQHNLFKELPVVMNDLAEINKELPAVVAYQKVQAALEKPVADNKDLRNWLGEKSLAGYKTEALPDGHYVLVHKLGTGPAAVQEVATRLRRLEDSFKSFYLWFALKSTDGKLPHDKNGKELLAMPDQRLLALLVTEDFEKKQKALYPFPLVHDGFYLRQANVAVFAGEPLDPMFKALKISNQDVQDNKIETLLKGRMSDVDKDRPYNEVMALLLTVMQDQAIVSTSTHEVTRQLAEVSGLLPRGVSAPRWIQFGMGSFFETPKGSPWSTVTGPSPVYLPEYQHWAEAKKNINHAEELKRVVTDQYFRMSENGKDHDALIKARMLSWALTYYLAENRLPELLKYYQELAKLPRNLEFDDDVLLTCFGRAFDLMDPANPSRLSPERVTSLADKWHQSLKFVKLEGDKLFQQARKLETEEPPKPVVTTAPPGSTSGGGGTQGQ